MTSNPSQKLFKNPFPFPLLPLLLLAGIFYINFTSRIIFSPLLPVIQTDLGLGYAKAGSLFLLAAFGYSLGSLGSGFVIAFLNYRHVLLLVAGMTGMAMLWMSQATSAAGLYLGLIILGISGGLYIPSGIGFLTNLIPKEHWGKAIGVHELAPNIGLVSAPLIAEAILSLFSWRVTLAFMGGWSLIMGGIFFLFARGGREHGHPPNFHAMRQVFSHPAFWFMAVLFTIALGVNLGVYNMTPLFLVRE